MRVRRFRVSQGALLAAAAAAAFLVFAVFEAARAEEPGTVSAPRKEYNLRFDGNAALGEAELRQAAVSELTEFERRGLRAADADDAAFQMELHYRGAGYAFARVDYRLLREGGKTTLLFEVSEGPRLVLGTVRFSGNTAHTDKELAGFSEAQKTAGGERVFVQSAIDGMASAIRDLYLGDGYLDVEVQAPRVLFSEDRTRADVEVEIREGTRYVIRHVAFTGDFLPEVREALAAAESEILGKPYFRRRKLLLSSRVLEAYGDLGYPYVTADVRESYAEGGQVRLDVAIQRGPQVTVSEIEVEGNERTRKGFIRNRVRFAPGDRYSLQKEWQSFQELYQAGLFSRVDLTLGQPDPRGRASLTVEVEEAPAKELYVEPGWGSYELARLRVGFREKNLFGTGRIAGTEASSSVKSQGFTVNLTDPWFLNTGITAELPISYLRREEPSFTREELSGSLNLSRPLGEHWLVTAGYQYRVTQLVDVDVDAAAEDVDTDYRLGSVRTQATYDTRDDLFFPTRGQRSFFSMERADEFFGGDLAFTRLGLGTRFFFRLGQSSVLGLRYSTGLIIPGANGVTIPLGERYFNGGENTVRSFYESNLGPRDASGDPSGGLAFNVVTAEFRQRLAGNFAGSLFIDLGNVSPNRSRAESGEPAYDSRSEILSDTYREFFQDFRPAIGFGIQYLLPVGPARLDFAFNPDADVDRGERRFVFHFSVGMAF